MYSFLLYFFSWLRHLEIYTCYSMFRYFIPLCCRIVFHCMDILFIHSLVDGHLSCYRILSLLVKQLLTFVHKFLNGQVLLFLLVKHKSGMARFYCMFMVNFLRNCKMVFQNGCTIFHFYQYFLKIPVPSHSQKHFLWSVFKILHILFIV